MEPILNLRVNKWLAILRAEHDVVIQLGVRAGHEWISHIVSPLRGLALD
jgi:hypothetical protein